MKKHDPKRPKVDIRRRAEERLKELEPGAPVPPEDTARLLHELQVHQIELELQNEELREAQARAEEVLEKYIDLYDFAPLGYFTVDEEGIVREANLTGAQLAGAERSRLIGRPLLIWLTKESIPAFTRLLDAMKGRDSVTYCDIVLTNESRHVHLTGTETSTTAVGKRHFRLAMTDITELKQAEERSQLYCDDLARSNKDLEQFAYLASHDLQEPLRMVTGFVDMLQKNYSQIFDAEAAELFNYITDGAKRMQALISDLLAFSHIGRDSKLDDDVDLNQVLHDVLRSMNRQLDEVNAKVHCQRLPAVKGKPALLAQVFLNILNNAIKFRAKEKNSLEISVTAAEESDGWKISIRDNGIGFPSRSAERIFDIFQRLHPQTQYGGTGIGLAICRRIIELHGGRIWAESEPGRGSIFHFTLPAQNL